MQYWTNSSGVSAMRMSFLWVAAMPSAPTVVETTGSAIAMAFRILTRIPLPERRGTMKTAQSDTVVRTSST